MLQKYVRWEAEESALKLRLVFEMFEPPHKTEKLCPRGFNFS